MVPTSALCLLKAPQGLLHRRTVQCWDKSREKLEPEAVGLHQAGPVPGQHEGRVAKPAHFSLDFILVHLTPPQLRKGICWSFVTHLQAHQGCLTC